MPMGEIVEVDLHTTQKGDRVLRFKIKVEEDYWFDFYNTTSWNSVYYALVDLCIYCRVPIIMGRSGDTRINERRFIHKLVPMIWHEYELGRGRWIRTWKINRYRVKKEAQRIR